MQQQYRVWCMKSAMTHSKNDALNKLASLKLQYRTMLCWKATPFKLAPRKRWVVQKSYKYREILFSSSAARAHVHFRIGRERDISNIAKWNVITGLKLNCRNYILNSINNPHIRTDDFPAFIPVKSDLSRFTPLVIVFTIPLWSVLAPPTYIKVTFNKKPHDLVIIVLISYLLLF